MGRSVVVALLLLLVPAVMPAATVYLDMGEYIGQLLPGYYLEQFEIDAGGYVSPMTFNNPSYPFTVASGTSADPSDESCPSCGIWAGVVPGGNGFIGAYMENDTLTLTFGAGVTSVAGLFAGNSSDDNSLIPGSITVTVSDGTSRTITNAADAYAFIGFWSSTPIAWMTITGPQFFAMDNMYVGQGSGAGGATPEPASLALAVAGCALLAFVRRRVAQ